MPSSAGSLSGSTRSTPRAASNSSNIPSTSRSSVPGSARASSIMVSTPDWKGRPSLSPLPASTASSGSPWASTSTSTATPFQQERHHIDNEDDTFVPFSGAHTTNHLSSSSVSHRTSISSLRRTSKLASISPRQPANPSSQQYGIRSQRANLSPQKVLSRSAATTPTATSGNEFSPPRASLESIQRRLYEEAAQEGGQRLPEYSPLDPNSASTAAAATVLVLHALQSPAKIGSSPVKGRGVSSIFPPSPDGLPNGASLSATLRSNRHAASNGKTRARSRSLRNREENQQYKEDDENDYDTDVSPAPPPNRRRSLKARENDELHPHDAPSSSQHHNMLSNSMTTGRIPKKRFDLSDWQFDLAAIASATSPAAKTPTSRSFPSSLHDEQSLEVSPAPNLTGRASVAELRGSHRISNRPSKLDLSSRDPFKPKRSNNATLTVQQSTSGSTSSSSKLLGRSMPMTAPQPVNKMASSRPPLQYRPNQPQSQSSFGQAGSASLFGTPLAGDVSSSSLLAASARRSSRPLLSRSAAAQHHRTHSRNKSNEQALKDLRSTVETPLSSNVEHISSSFDAAASAIRHRQRTKSISESEGNPSDSEDDAGADESLNLPESPDLVMDGTEGRDGYIEAGIFSGMSVNDAIGKQREIPFLQTSADEMQLDEDEETALEKTSPTLQEEYDDSHDSLFLDTPGRSRGSSMPSGPQAAYTLTTSLPFPQPQLKPSRVSYPPKILYTTKTSDDSDARAKNPLHSSVPASTKGGQTPGNSQRGLDQLFLASILNGTTPLPSASLSVKRHPSMSLSKSAGTSLVRNSSDGLKTAKSMQPLSPNASHIGRKRNAHGAMIASANSREASTIKPVNKPDSLTHIELPRGRPSMDGSTDEESGISPTLPPLTDSSSATSSLASSQRSGKFPGHSVRDHAGKPATVSEQDTEKSINLDDLSFLSDSTMPSFDERSNSRMPRTFSTSRDLSENSSKLPKSSGQLKSPGTPGLPSGIPRRTSPHFRNVRPLQAAFMNSGLLSKKSIRSRLDRDSGIGLGGTPPAPALRRLLHQERRGNSSMHSTPGSQPSLSFSTPSHYSTSFSSIQSGSPLPTVEIAPSNSMDAEAFANASSSSIPRRMPDTPCKRAPLYPQLRQATVTVDSAVKEGTRLPEQGLHPLAQCSRPTVGRSASSCSSTVSDSSSVVNSIPGSAIKLKERPFMSPSYRNGNTTGNKFSRKSNASGSPSSSGSPCAIQDVAPRSAIPRRKVGPALFRRRSSGQIQTSADGSFMAVSERSGGSNRSGIVDWEPMTPTRTYAEQEWLSLPALATSPKTQSQPAGRPYLTAETAILPEACMASPTSPLATSPLAAQSTQYTGSDRNASASLPQPHMTQVKQLQRPAFRARHSSSVVHTARQTELLSPDRFSTLFSISRTLGQGEFSEAFEVRDRATDEIYAVKKTKAPLAGHKARLRRLEEVDILRLLSSETSSSPFVIKLFYAWEQAGNLYIQTELCPFGNLAFFLEEYGRMYETLDEARVWKILSELASGVAYVHQHGVLHLDLKPANIFISSNGSLKLGDFGLATRWPRVRPITILQGAAVHSPGWDAAAASTVWLSERSRSKSSDEKRDSQESMHDLEREGDREYIAPEILRGQYGRPADMFALGLVILEAAANVVLPDNGLPWRKLRENDLSDVDTGHLSDELVYIIVHLLQSDPAQRTTIDELQAHPVVSKMQRLRQRGFELEGLPENTIEESSEHASVVSYAKGAIVEERESFLPSIMAEVRRIWHSPRKSKLPVSKVATQEEGSEMEIDM